MPFHSKKQSSACFATGGFGGKVDCEEWASKTNYKKLPKRKHKINGFREWIEENYGDFNLNNVVFRKLSQWYGGRPNGSFTDEAIRAAGITDAEFKSALTSGILVRDTAGNYEYVSQQK